MEDVTAHSFRMVWPSLFVLSNATSQPRQSATSGLVVVSSGCSGISRRITMSDSPHFTQGNDGVTFHVSTEAAFAADSANEDQRPSDSPPKNGDSLESYEQKGSQSSSSTTHLTIQLSEDAEGSSLSQQKLQELIMQLSRSGQLQLKEESKIIIEVKGGQKTAESKQPKSRVADQVIESDTKSRGSDTLDPETDQSSNSVTPQASSTATAANHGVTSSTLPPVSKVVVTPYQQQLQTTVSAANSYQTSTKVVSSGTAGGPVPLQPYQLQSNQQAPTYIIIPTRQLGGNQLNISPSQSGIATTDTASSSSLRVLTQPGQHFLLQTPFSKPEPASAISSFSLKTATMLTGERSVVVLQQQHHTPAPIVPVRQLTTTSHSGGSRLPLAQSTPMSTAGSRLCRSDGYSNAGVSSRESSWQQYVKQFAKLGPCPICGDKISGYHYGIFCCESCKGFFKRTVQNAKRYACHMATPSSLCEITAASRKKCPACRFVKCLEKGMRMEAIRSDRTRGGRSMYPGSRYLRQLAARASGTPGDRKPTTLATLAPLPSSGAPSGDSINMGVGSSSASSLQMVPMTLGPNGLPASEDVGGGVYLDPAVLDDSVPTTVSQGQSEFSDYDYKHLSLSGILRNQQHNTADMPKLLREILKVEESVEAEPEESLDFDSAEDEATVYRALLNLADQRLYRIVRWSRALPVFTNLDTDDQILLLQNCWADLLCLDCCWKSLPTPTEIRLTSSKCINLDVACEKGANDLVSNLLQLTQDLKRLRLTIVDFACLKVILLMQPDLANLRAVRQVKQFQECVSRMLMEHTAATLPEVPNKFAELLVRIPELQRTSSLARELLVDKDLSPYLSSNSLLMELLRSDFQRQSSVVEGGGVASPPGSLHQHHHQTVVPTAQGGGGEVMCVDPQTLSLESLQTTNNNGVVVTSAAAYAHHEGVVDEPVYRSAEVSDPAGGPPDLHQAYTSPTGTQPGDRRGHVSNSVGAI
nr:unnamed protein product [Spirometra erinaceieuropaei]